MQYVYFIKSLSDDFMYIGCTSDLNKRIAEHNNGLVPSTSRYAPLKLCYYEAYLDLKDAFKREHNLKHSGGAIGHLKNRIKNSLTMAMRTIPPPP